MYKRQKLASGLAKPDGLVVVPEAEAVAFVQQLPVGALWGVGERTEEALLRLGLHTVADIAHTPQQTLRRALVEVGAQLHDLSWARDPRRVTVQRREKSVGSDETFSYDSDDPEEIRRPVSYTHLDVYKRQVPVPAHAGAVTEFGGRGAPVATGPGSDPGTRPGPRDDEGSSTLSLIHI